MPIVNKANGSSRSGVPTARARNLPALSCSDVGLFAYPHGFTVDAQGNLWVSDRAGDAANVTGPFLAPSVSSTLPSALSLRTSWPITTPSAFFADMPSTIGSSFTSILAQS
jgi:hypothetical protein